MEILIGRDEKTAQLRLAVGQDITQYGEADSVPLSVSRQHCCLVIHDNGKWQLKNLNPQNVTRVNGILVTSKTVTKADRVELGEEGYVLPWEAVESTIPPSVDIRPLKTLWDEYTLANQQLKINERRFGALRSGVGIISMAAIVFGVILGRSSSNHIYRYLSHGIAIIGGFLHQGIPSVQHHGKAAREDSEGFPNKMCMSPLRTVFGQLSFL